MELDRRFVEHTGKGSSQSFEFYGSPHNAMGWPDLLKRRRAVVLAEAGSGKSEEFKLQAAALSEAGEAVFLQTVTEAAEKGFEASLRKGAREALAQWRASDKPAWFLLDSVDEAKSRRLDLARALDSLADAIDGCERRAHVILSGRPSDWEPARDLATFDGALAVPPEPDAPEAVDPGARAMNIFRGKSRKPAATQDEGTLVVAMLALDDERVSIFARGSGIEAADVFIAALERHGLSRFARRPLDLKWLAQHWRDRGSFGSLREMLELSLSHRLRETNGSLARVDPLSLADCNRALDRIGATMVLRRVDSVAVPDSGLDVGADSVALDLAELLPEWPAEDRAKLIGRAAFPPGRSGFVRLDNDNQGAVRSFLAARWISALLDANCPRSRIHELLFADTYGARLIIPSMAETVAWLSISHPWVAEQAIARDPWPLLNLGDPQSLPLDVRARALRAILTADELQTFDRLPNQVALRRLAQPDMGPAVRALWADFNGKPRARQLLLQLIWLGRLESCADIARDASFGAHSDRLTQVFAGRAIASAGSVADKSRYAAHLSQRRAELDSEVFWDGVDELFPGHFDAHALAKALGDADMRAKSSPEELSRRGGALAGRIDDAAGAEAVLRAALAAMRDEPRALFGEPHPLADIAARCTSRMLELRGGAAPPEIAIDAAVECILAHGRGRPRQMTAIEELSQAVSRSAEGRRSLLWAFCDRVRKIPEIQHPIRSVSHLGIFGARIDLKASDWKWLAEDAASRQADSDAELATHSVLRMWRDAGDPPELLEKIQGVAQGRAIVAEALATWTNPPARSAQEIEFDEQIRSHEATAQREASEVERSWASFIEDLRRDPTQLRSCILPSEQGVDWRILHLWKLVDGEHGSQTRHSNGDLSPLTPLLGTELIAEFAAALPLQWRAWAPTPRCDRSDGQRNTLGAPDLVGLLALAVEARSDSLWASRLTSEEARRAVFYATLEINGFPAWIAQIAAAKPDETRDALLHCCFGEWTREEAGAFQCAIDDLSRAEAPLPGLLAGRLLDRLRSDPPAAMRILEPVVAIVQKGGLESAVVAPAMLDLFRSEPAPDKRAIYLGAAFGADPAAACAALDQALDALTPADRKALVQASMPRIFGGDWSTPAVDASSMPLAVLRRMVDIAHRETPPSDDPRRPNNDVYSPDIRDHAEAARSHALGALLRRPGLATHEAIQSMIATGFPTDRIVMERWARDRAAEDSESAPWRPADVAAFERDWTAAPRTARDLQTIAMRRFEDLQDELSHGDFNQGATVAALPNEAAVQNWFADRFKREARGSFSITRESHMADEKEPDLRVEAKASEASLPIEIKVAESWSMRQLEDALRVQLMGRYLRPQDAKWGILLLVHQERRAKGWEDGAGSHLDIDQVAERLRETAREIAAADAGSAQMEVALIDVSSERIAFH